MKIFINLPTWLGDAVMASTALYALKDFFKKQEVEWIFYGSFVSCELFREFPNTLTIVAKKNRYFHALKLRKELGDLDLALSFRSAFSSKIILNILKAKKKFFFNKKHFEKEHQVLQYLYFVQNSLHFKTHSQNLALPFHFTRQKKTKLLGINAGAAFGSAKRWRGEYFAEVAQAFKDEYIVLLFGVQNESELCKQIENLLTKQNVKVQNLCGKTSIKELCQHIFELDLLLTNDSGSMHIAAVYKINTIAIFGPTAFEKSSPWQNKNARIIHLNLSCMPCMKRVCPLGHHQCMQDLKPHIVIKEAKKLLQQKNSIQ
ncbi:lipopolysaccharide heptosyltransferase II [Campylobacter sp. MIT 21-1685]|uniref:lipopolysaccharide heptosyltransferase II n=1 Tax=unclassified Campylobacter TaxID=2593542 RepID=UPI00224AB385|nr:MULTISPECIES: lipopolysaccharide heptosyltransferase II [unclassified Campylobacter]MCX2683692.1 lipopolysaccharide heptosyltransferase II [Campylobacter sp. MIT 21-1684]MCX2751977.1 lipopolysaccharide heptosyltransferase II [Campylobacter sp. MIT 21-1682]MCX2808161.1 lipopolysaccharide heptosyltransferase II [Campylobacter sp. MIT 21-1685]